VARHDTSKTGTAINSHLALSFIPITGAPGIQFEVVGVGKIVAGELARPLVVFSWLLDVQPIDAVILYRSAYLSRQKLCLFLRSVIIQRTLRKESI
jgi:hypothetical protein